MTPNNYALKPCTFGNGLVHASIPFADSFSRENRITGGSSRRAACKEALGIIIDIMMAPREYRPSLVREQGKRAAEIMSEETDWVAAINN